MTPPDDPAPPAPAVAPIRPRSDVLATTLIHAGVATMIVLVAGVLCALHDLSESTVSAILGSTLGWVSGTSVSRRIGDRNGGGG